MFDLIIDFYMYVAFAVGVVATVIFVILEAVFSNLNMRDQEKVRKMQVAVFVVFFVATMMVLIWIEPPPPPFWLRD